MAEFSRRVDVDIIEDEPKSLEEFSWDHPGWDVDDLNAAYERYLHYFQPFRWHAVGMNHKIVSDGESYHNRADAINACELLFGDDTTVYLRQHEQGNQLLRYGKTDREHQAAGGAQ